jgi:hypothetical protein
VRRVASVVLLVLGGWMLTSEAMIAWLDVGQGIGPQLLGIAIFLPIAGIPLALGTWASPGNRPADLGLTLMTTAGVSAFCALTVFLVANDPQVAKVMPPDRPMPSFEINPILGGVDLLLIAGGGYLLWRKGRAKAKAKDNELERVFGD